MRIAILSAFETLEGDPRTPRAFARIGGQSVIELQAVLALSAGAEKIVCLANGLSPEIIAIQHRVEDADARFHCIRDSRGLAGLTSAGDELLVMADSGVFERGTVEAFLLKGRGVATFPADAGITAGFERLDRERSWAGLMLVSGALVEKLSDMPQDIDPVSALLRLALQSCTRMRALDPQLLQNQNWLLVDRRETAASYSEKWLAGSLDRALPSAPTLWLADRVADMIAARNGDLHRSSQIAMALSVILVLGGALAATQAWFVAALFCVFLTVCSVRAGAMFTQILSLLGDAFPWKIRFQSVMRVLVDLALVALPAMAAPPLKQSQALFTAVILIGLIRIDELRDERQSLPWLGQAMADRGLIALAMIAGLSLEILIPVLQAYAIILLAGEFLRIRSAKLTQV